MLCPVDLLGICVGPAGVRISNLGAGAPKYVRELDLAAQFLNVEVLLRVLGFLISGKPHSSFVPFLKSPPKPLPLYKGYIVASPSTCINVLWFSKYLHVLTFIGAATQPLGIRQAATTFICQVKCVDPRVRDGGKITGSEPLGTWTWCSPSRVICFSFLISESWRMTGDGDILTEVYLSQGQGLCQWWMKADLGQEDTQSPFTCWFLKLIRSPQVNSPHAHQLHRLVHPHSGIGAHVTKSVDSVGADLKTSPGTVNEQDSEQCLWYASWWKTQGRGDEMQIWVCFYLHKGTLESYFRK